MDLDILAQSWKLIYWLFFYQSSFIIRSSFSQHWVWGCRASKPMRSRLNGTTVCYHHPVVEPFKLNVSIVTISYLFFLLFVVFKPPKESQTEEICHSWVWENDPMQWFSSKEFKIDLKWRWMILYHQSMWEQSQGLQVFLAKPSQISNEREKKEWAPYMSRITFY